MPREEIDASFLAATTTPSLCATLSALFDRGNLIRLHPSVPKDHRGFSASVVLGADGRVLAARNDYDPVAFFSSQIEPLAEDKVDLVKWRDAWSRDWNDNDNDSIGKKTTLPSPQKKKKFIFRQTTDPSLMSLLCLHLHEHDKHARRVCYPFESNNPVTVNARTGELMMGAWDRVSMDSDDGNDDADDGNDDADDDRFVCSTFPDPGKDVRFIITAWRDNKLIQRATAAVRNATSFEDVRPEDMATLCQRHIDNVDGVRSEAFCAQVVRECQRLCDELSAPSIRVEVSFGTYETDSHTAAFRDFEKTLNKDVEDGESARLGSHVHFKLYPDAPMTTGVPNFPGRPTLFRDHRGVAVDDECIRKLIDKTSGDDIDGGSARNLAWRTVRSPSRRSRSIINAASSLWSQTKSLYPLRTNTTADAFALIEDKAMAILRATKESIAALDCGANSPTRNTGVVRVVDPATRMASQVKGMVSRMWGDKVSWKVEQAIQDILNVASKQVGDLATRLRAGEQY